MNAPTLVELRTAVAALHQKRMNEIAPKHYRTERDYFTLLAELNLTHQLNTKLEEELKLKLPSAQFLNWLKALDFIDHAQVPELSPSEWLTFARDPGRFLKHANDAQQAAILHELERSQQP